MKRSRYIKVFLLGFILMFFIILPDIVRNDGKFLYGADYSNQMIPFYQYGVSTVQNGAIGWDWLTDLGTDFIGSYSYYFLGSPFFWLICLIPSDMVIYAMPFVLCFKVAVASLTSYIYIERYVKKENSALIGALLYSFCGFQFYNVVFYFFHDVTALFPLLLLSFDMLVKDNKKCFFALMTAVMALTNYYFFFGEVVFVILYYIIRCISKDFKFTCKNFFTIMFEAVIGVAASAVILFPTMDIVLSGGRAGNILYGANAIVYEDNHFLPKIIQSLFLNSDLPQYGQLFHSGEKSADWGSTTLYMPLFAVMGVVTYIYSYKKSWISKLLIISLIFSGIPILNSTFSMLNAGYYSRWFFMPVLFMSISTAKAIDEELDFKPGIKFQSIGLAVLVLISFLPQKFPREYTLSDNPLEQRITDEPKIKWFGMCENPTVFWQNILFGVISVLIIFIYENYRRDGKHKNMEKKLSVILVGFILINGVIYHGNVAASLKVDNFYESVFDYKPIVEDNEDFSRLSSINFSFENANILWNKPVSDSFHSINLASIQNYYKAVTGKTKSMRGPFYQEDYAVHGLLSVKYIFNSSTNDDLNVEYASIDVCGFELYDKQNYYYIYENQHFVPMGFMYDYCIDKKTIDDYVNRFENVTIDDRYRYKQLIMMRAMVLDDADIEKYSDLLPKIPTDKLADLDEKTYFSDCEDRKATSCDSFTYDEKGFKATINADRSGIVFFSVPESSGWSAKVNGEKTDIITSQYGFMSVYVESGDSLIEFSYQVPGLKEGIIVTSSALVLYIIYVFITLRSKLCKKSKIS